MTHRRATHTDAEAIARLHIASWQSAYRGLIPDPILDAVDVETRIGYWESHIADPATVVLLAQAANIPIGFCASGPSRDQDAEPAKTWEIYNLHVAPDRRDRGIGAALFDAAVRLGRDREAAKATLWVITGNRAARRFYERKGMIRDISRHTLSESFGVFIDETRYRTRIGDAVTKTP